MIRNYLKTAWRNLWKNRGYSILNIGGLAMGMTAGFLILLYISFELSYDGFYSKASRIYRVVTDITTPSDQYENAVVDWNILGELQSDFPEIEDNTRVFNRDIDVQVNNENYKESKAIAADPAFFNLFDFKLIQGNPATALSSPLSIVLSKTKAQKYFGKEDPMGKTLKIMDGQYSVTVTGVMEDIPDNTVIKGDLILSLSTYTEIIDLSLNDSWAEFSNFGYVLLNKNVNPDILEKKIKTYNEKAHGDQMKETNLKLVYHLEHLKDVYLYSNRGGASAQINNVYVFSLIALFIVLIAAINFINLSTARSVERAKEVGIRKVIGAQKGQLAFQFLSESVIICFFAFVLSVILAMLALPYFNELAGKIVATNIFEKPSNILSLSGIAVGIALIAGSYPALILSSFKTIHVLKGKFSGSSRGTLLRKGLVISQFTISIILIMGTIIIYNQTHFMRSQDLGFSKEQLIFLETGSGAGQKLLESALAKNPNILSMSTGSGVPGGGGNMEAVLSIVENSEGRDQTLALKRYIVDPHYITQLGIELIAGRNFSKQFASDSTQAVILNEKAIKLLGFVNPENALGKNFDQEDKKGQIIGVVKDFHFTSLQKEIRPLSIVMGTTNNQLLNLKVSTTNLKETLSSIETYWDQYFPNKPFDYYFLDEFFDRQYRSEQRFGNLFLNFAILAIFISCLGLLGLAAYSTLQRRREIGIRKILGASVPGIINLLSKEFIKLVGIAFLIAVPIAWFGMYKWLQDFAYRVDISWWIFALAGISAIGIAILTISFQAIKAAIANPVKNLRTE